jgi:hypothetical protein
VNLSERVKHVVGSFVLRTAQLAPNYFRTSEQQEGAAAFLERRRLGFASWR